MNFIAEKWEEFKNQPIKNKIAIFLMLGLSIAVIIKYYPSSQESGMQLIKKSKSTNQVTSREPIAGNINNQATSDKISSAELKQAVKVLKLLEANQQGIYLTKKISETELQRLARSSQVNLTQVEKVQNKWQITGTSKTFGAINYFVNAALKNGMDATQADVQNSSQNQWDFKITLQSINE